MIHLGCRQEAQQCCFSLKRGWKKIFVTSNLPLFQTNHVIMKAVSLLWAWQILFWCTIIGAVQHDQQWRCVSSPVITFFWSAAAWLQRGFPVPEERHKAATPPCYVLWGMSSSYQDDVTIHSPAKHCACVVSTASVWVWWWGLMGNVTIKWYTGHNGHYTCTFVINVCLARL